MKKDLSEYLDEEESSESGEETAKDETDTAEGMNLKDMKAELLARKYEQTHEPEKRVKVLMDLIKCIAGKDEAYEEE